MVADVRGVEDCATHLGDRYMGIVAIDAYRQPARVRLSDYGLSLGLSRLFVERIVLLNQFMVPLRSWYEEWAVGIEEELWLKGLSSF